jgi:succinate dehydrogenase flavin-adding protein (antitoxin of CptAB toxin-antitoxin module)
MLAEHETTSIATECQTALATVAKRVRTPMDRLRAVLTEDECDVATELYKLMQLLSRIEYAARKIMPEIDIMAGRFDAKKLNLTPLEDMRVRKLLRLRDYMEPELWRVCEVYFEQTRSGGVSSPDLAEIGLIALPHLVSGGRDENQRRLGAGMAISRAMIWRVKAFFETYGDLVLAQQTEAMLVAALKARLEAASAARAKAENSINCKAASHMLGPLGLTGGLYNEAHRRALVSNS